MALGGSEEPMLTVLAPAGAAGRGGRGMPSCSALSLRPFMARILSVLRRFLGSCRDTNIQTQRSETSVTEGYVMRRHIQGRSETSVTKVSACSLAPAYAAGVSISKTSALHIWCCTLFLLGLRLQPLLHDAGPLLASPTRKQEAWFAWKYMSLQQELGRCS